MGSEVGLSTRELQSQAVELAANVKGQAEEAECSGPLGPAVHSRHPDLARGSLVLAGGCGCGPPGLLFRTCA